jgi:hypothetical protein
VFARAMQTGTFRSDMRPPYVPGRVAIMMWAHEAAAIEEANAEILARFANAANERWQVLLHPASIHGAWAGFAPACEPTDPLRVEEPVVVLIHGVLRARYLFKFTRDSARVGRQLVQANGYLGGVALSDTPLTTASFSCWRTARDSRAFAFGAGAHQHAYKIDRNEHRHATEFFVRFRPIAAEGTLDGKDPFAGVLKSGASVLGAPSAGGVTRTPSVVRS